MSDDHADWSPVITAVCLLPSCSQSDSLADRSGSDDSTTDALSMAYNKQIRTGNDCNCQQKPALGAVSILGVSSNGVKLLTSAAICYRERIPHSFAIHSLC